jgi:hypothetical protein
MAANLLRREIVHQRFTDPHRVETLAGSGRTVSARTAPHHDLAARRHQTTSDDITGRSSIMWLLLKGLALRFVIGRTVGGTLAALLLVSAPVAGLLKFVGLPLVIVLGVIGAPVLLLLGAVGLPILLVLGIGGVLLLLLAALLAMGAIAIKILLPIVLVVWLVRWVWRKN